MVYRRSPRVVSSQVSNLRVWVGRFVVIGSPGRFGRVAEWQTRWLQVPVSFGTWGFKSPFAHSERLYITAAQRSRTRFGS